MNIYIYTYTATPHFYLLTSFHTQHRYWNLPPVDDSDECYYCYLLIESARITYIWTITRRKNSTAVLEYSITRIHTYIRGTPYFFLLTPRDSFTIYQMRFTVYRLFSRNQKNCMLLHRVSHASTYLHTSSLLQYSCCVLPSDHAPDDWYPCYLMIWGAGITFIWCIMKRKSFQKVLTKDHHTPASPRIHTHTYTYE